MKNDINYKDLNSLIKTYKKLGKILYTLVIIGIVAISIFLLIKLDILNIFINFLELLIPLFAGCIIAWLLNPIINKLSRKIPRVVSSIIVYLVLLLIAVFMVYLIVPSIIREGSTLIKNLPNIIRDVTNSLDSFFDNNIDVKNKIINFISNYSSNIEGNLSTNIVSGTISTFKFIANLVFAIMIGFYLSIDYRSSIKFIKRFIPLKYMDDFKDLTIRINHSLRKYFDGVLLVMLLVFITQSIGFTIAGLKAPLVFAMFCAFTDIIPYFGPWIGAIPAVLYAFFISPVTGLITIISIMICQSLENNFYQPLIMGHSMKLHPVVIMLGLVIFGHFFGVIGMILATPTIATLKIILEFINEKTDYMKKIKNL